MVRVPVDSQGRMRATEMPPLSGPAIVCMQAGNVNTGAFDPAAEICARAHSSGAWVHVDGAFGLWAAASPKYSHLVAGVADADSWATDAHKWLNVPYDSGLAFVRNAAALKSAMSVAAAGQLVVEVVSMTIFQRVVPDAIRGRAIGGIASLSTLSLAAGSLALPILAGGIGIGVTLLGSGVAFIAATVVAVALLGSSADRPEDAMTVTLRRVARLPVFAGVAPARLEIALRDLSQIQVAAGEVVIRQGETADRFYIIESGRFEVTQLASGSANEQRVLRTMGPDEVFGEIGLLTSAPRTATVTAVGAGTLLVMSGPAFLELVCTGPGLATRLLDLHRGASVPRGTGEATNVLSGT